MTPEDKQILFRVAQWIGEGNRKVVQKIRELAETEENYLIIIRELDRVTGQVTQARQLQAEATLTLMDWLVTLEDFNWQCAYCQSKPFQVMCHVIPLSVGGTTPENCVPACYSCCRYRKTGDARVQAYLASRKNKYEQDEKPNTV
jgi:5-methylcytosine-specific restriction endonuclease McrA